MSSVLDDIDEEDWYGILEVPSAATEEQIAQSYRKLARKWHPDRNHGNPKAAETFMKIKKALEVLTDEKKRKEYDGKIQARLLRKKKREEMQAGVRKMKDDLIERENAYKRQKLSEEHTKKQTEAEMARLREDARRKMQQEAQKRATAAGSEDEQKRAEKNPDTSEEGVKVDDGAIRIKWKHKKTDFTREQIETIFSSYGQLEYCVLPSSSSTKRNGRAMLAYKNVGCAINAMREMKEQNIYGFKMEWVSGHEPTLPAPEAPHHHHHQMDTKVEDLDNFEAEVMRKMQEAAKRKKAAAQAAAQAAQAAQATQAAEPMDE